MYFDPFFGGLGVGHDPVRAAAIRKRRALEAEAARRREVWEHEQRRRARRQHSLERLARRVWSRTYFRAAATIQRAWRAHSAVIRATKAAAAATTITRTIRRAGAVVQARRVAGSLRALAGIEAEAAAVPAAFAIERAQLAFEDALEKITLRLDRIESHGSPFVRERRRAVVRAVQRRLDGLDAYRSSGSEVAADSDGGSGAGGSGGGGGATEMPTSHGEHETEDELPESCPSTTSESEGASDSEEGAMDGCEGAGWTEVTHDELDADDERRRALRSRVADARATVAALEAELAAAERGGRE